jgi:hypothetical protein
MLITQPRIAHIASTLRYKILIFGSSARSICLLAFLALTSGSSLPRPTIPYTTYLPRDYTHIILGSGYTIPLIYLPLPSDLQIVPALHLVP